MLVTSVGKGDDVQVSGTDGIPLQNQELGSDGFNVEGDGGVTP